MQIIFGDGLSIRGWQPNEDYKVSAVVSNVSIIGVDGTETVNDITYNITASTETTQKYDWRVTTKADSRPVTFESVTPTVCSVDAEGHISRVSNGTCIIETTGQTGKRRYSQLISTVGAVDIYDSVQSFENGSLRKYLYDQQIAALDGVTPGSDSQRAHAVAGSMTSAVNTGNFLRAQSKSGFHPFQLDVLDEILAGGSESIRWRAWITPHHYLTWLGHGAASSPGQWVTIFTKGLFFSKETAVRYSATPWTGNLCKLLPANLDAYLPASLLEDGSSAFGVWARLYNTYDMGADKRWVMPAEHGGEPLLPASDPRYPYQKHTAGSNQMANGGDSGTPVWIGIREGANSYATIVPVGITSFYGQLGGTVFYDILTEIQDAVTLLNASGSYTIQTVDLSGFTSYA